MLGEINLETFEVIDPVERPRISGFVVKGFTGSGIFAVGTEDLRATHNWAKDNTGYGIFVLLSTRPVLAYNKASGNGDAGLYVGSNQQVDAKVFGNSSWDNPIGIFLRDVSHGTAERNHVFGNCSGILLLAGAPGPVTEWRIRRNLVRAITRPTAVRRTRCRPGWASCSSVPRTTTSAGTWCCVIGARAWRD